MVQQHPPCDGQLTAAWRREGLLILGADGTTAYPVCPVPVSVGCGLLAEQLLPDVGHRLQQPPLLRHLLLQLLADQHSTMINSGNIKIKLIEHQVTIDTTTLSSHISLSITLTVIIAIITDYTIGSFER